MTGLVITPADTTCLNCGRLVPCGCTEPMPAADAYAQRRAVADDAPSSIVQQMPEVVNTPRAWLDVLAERRRQISEEGWTPEHDDQHGDGELAAAGATYALSAASGIVEQPFHRTWPWLNAWWKPTDPRRDLVKAGALILAEIERLDRADKQEGQAHG